MTAVEQHVVNLEEQLITTRDTAERHRLLQSFIKELVRFQKHPEFSSVVERRIEKNNERYDQQKELLARLKYERRKELVALKDEGPEITDAYFLAVTIKTMLALYDYHRALTRKILVFVVPQPT